VIFIGIDDTDNKESRGTGHMSRMLAQELRSEIEVYGITRHQLLVDPRIPYTAKNSCAALHINANGDPASGGTANSGIDLTALAERVADFVQSESAPGSDPAICVAQDVPLEVSQFGRRVCSTMSLPRTSLARWQSATASSCADWGAPRTASSASSPATTRPRKSP